MLLPTKWMHVFLCNESLGKCWIFKQWSIRRLYLCVNLFSLDIPSCLVSCICYEVWICSINCKKILPVLFHFTFHCHIFLKENVFKLFYNHINIWIVRRRVLLSVSLISVHHPAYFTWCPSQCRTHCMLPASCVNSMSSHWHYRSRILLVSQSLPVFLSAEYNTDNIHIFQIIKQHVIHVSFPLIGCWLHFYLLHFGNWYQSSRRYVN